jgi:hypothetical protein
VNGQVGDQTGRTAERWRRFGVAAMMLVVAARCTALIAMQLHFDVDPAQYGAALAGYGPAGSMLLDVLLLLGAGAVLAGEAWSGRRLDPWMLVAAALPVPVILWHGSSDAGDLWRGSTWIAAMVAAVAVAHAARDHRQRTLVFAILLALLAPLAARGIMQLTIEHTDTVAAFEQNREQFLNVRGWPPGSPAALIYERLLRQPQPRGWFATTNVLASLLAYGLVAWAGLAFAAARSRMTSGWIGVMSLSALIMAAGLVTSGSKGALLAAAAGVVVLFAPMLSPTRRDRWFDGLWRRRRTLLVALVVLTLGAVTVRGTLLPESFAGERSLLFRWHYLVGAARMVAADALTGVGPDGFQQAYAMHRLPRSPEEVTSAHSMLVDWTSMLGMVGLAWAALLMLLIGGRGAGQEPASSSDEGVRDVVPTVIAVGLGGIVLSTRAEWVALDELSGFVRAVGWGAFVVLALLTATVARHAGGRLTAWVMVAAAAALLVHGQIEMTFFSPGAVAWCLCAVALVARPVGRLGRRGAVVAGLIVLLVAAWLVVRGVVPAWRQEVITARAAARLRPLPDDRAQQVARRREAARQLVEAHAAWPANPDPLRAAVDQMLLAASAAAGDERLTLVRAADDLATECIEHGGGTGAVVARANVRFQLARLTDADADWQRAVDDARVVTILDPRAITSWMRLGDSLWSADRREEARDAYRRALQNHESFALDPLKQLQPARLAEIEGRLSGEAASPG